MLTKNAVGNLINRYKAVLANCRLMNMFGSLALAMGLASGAAGLTMGLALVGVSDAMADGIEMVYGGGDFDILDFGISSQFQMLGTTQVISTMQMMNFTSNSTVSSMIEMMPQGSGSNVDNSRPQADSSDPYVTHHTNDVPSDSFFTAKDYNPYKDKKNLAAYEEKLKDNLNPNTGVGGFEFQNWGAVDAYTTYTDNSSYYPPGTFKLERGGASIEADEVFGGDIQLGEIIGGSDNKYSDATKSSLYGNLTSNQSDRVIFSQGEILILGDGSGYAGKIDVVEGSHFTVESNDTSGYEGKFPACTIYQVDENGAVIAVDANVDTAVSNDSQSGVPIDEVTQKAGGSPPLELKEGSPDVKGNLDLKDGALDVKGNLNLKDAGSYNFHSTANMYAEASNDSGTFSDMGTSRSYMSPTDPVWSMFLSPYYSKNGQNNGDVHSNMVGLSMGATRFLNDQTLFGFSASISRAMSDTDGADSSATNYAVGMHAMYMFNNSAYIRGQLTGTLGQSNYDFQKDLYGQRLTADADMNSYGLYAQMAVGYSFIFGDSGAGADSGTKSAKTQTVQHTVRPELALSYFYNHMDGYSAEYYDGSFPTGYEFSLRSADYDALYTDLTVSWTGAFDIGHGEKDYGLLKPTVKVGVRQALTNPEVSSTMEMFGLSTVSHSDLNETAFLCETGLAWEMGDVTLSATYSGEFGNVEYSHSGMFTVEWKF